MPRVIQDSADELGADRTAIVGGYKYAAMKVSVKNMLESA
jgi:hypothetical protein